MRARESKRQVADSYARYRGGDESSAVICLEATLRSHRYDLVPIHQLPGLRALHQRFMVKKLVQRSRRPVRIDVGRTCDQAPIHRPNTSSDQVGAR